MKYFLFLVIILSVSALHGEDKIKVDSGNKSESKAENKEQKKEINKDDNEKKKSEEKNENKNKLDTDENKEKKTKDIIKPAEKKPVGFDIGLTYKTDYYYRGRSVYGANKGALFPFIGWGQKGFYLYFGGELDIELLGDNQNSTGNYALIYSFSYTGFVANDLMVLMGGLSYYMYPQSYKATGENFFKDYIVAKFLMSFNVLLMPTIEYEHSFYPGRGFLNSSGSADGYLTISIAHRFELTKENSVILYLKASMWYDGKSTTPGANFKVGVSDILATVKYRFAMKNGFAMESSINFGVSPDARFQEPVGDFFKWFATFGFSYSF